MIANPILTALGHAHLADALGPHDQLLITVDGRAVAQLTPRDAERGTYEGAYWLSRGRPVGPCFSLPFTPPNQTAKTLFRWLGDAKAESVSVIIHRGEG